MSSDRRLCLRVGWVSDQGQPLIVEQFPDSPGFAYATSILLALAYDRLIGGAGYDYATVRDSLTSAGYASIDRTKLRIARGTSLIRATL